MNFNFEVFLFYLTLAAGILSLLDIIIFAPQRARINRQGQAQVKMPAIFDYARSFFPVLLIVFLLRSFVVEPYRIPSSSLEPTLLTGDFILANKFKYGIRLPLTHTQIFAVGEPKRGDIMIFRWPPDPSYNYIKRVIGLPGDRISYINKELYINGKKIPQSFYPTVANNDNEWQKITKEEDLLGIKHKIYIFPQRNSRDYNDIIVPADMYFVMGDNRDDSADSRYWGFVPSANIVGKAMVVWMSWNNHYVPRFNRIGTIIH